MELIIKKENLFLVIIFGIFIFLSLFKLTINPASWFDEGIYHQITRNMAVAGKAGMQLSPGNYSEFSLISVGYSVFYPAVVAFNLFGDGILVLRLVALLFLTGFVISFYLLARKLYGLNLALWATALLVVFSPLYGDGKNFLGEVPGLFYFTLGLYFLTKLDQKRLYAFGSGILFGLAVSAKPIYLLILPALVLALIINYRVFIINRLGRKSAALVALGVTLPVVIWVVTQFGWQVSLTQIVNHYRNPNFIANLGDQFFSNLKGFVTQTTPAHFAMLLVLALIYFILSVKRKNKLAAPEVIVLVFCSLIFLSFIRTIGWYRYLFPGQALLFLFYPVSVKTLTSILPGAWTKSSLIVFVACGVLFAAQLGPIYKERLFTQLDAPTAFEPNLRAILPNEAVFFYNLPQISARFLGKNYWQFVTMNDNVSFGGEAMGGIKTGFYDYLFIPSNAPQIIKEVPLCYKETVNMYGVYEYKKIAGKKCGS